MPNIIKYSTTGVTNTINKGNFYLGVNSNTGGPTSTTGFWNGIQPPLSGYTLYSNKNDAFGPSINVFNNDAELISFVNQRGGNVSTIYGAINYFSSSDEFILVNKDYEPIVTDGLILNLDAGFSASYPKGGTSWYDLGLSGNNATLVNGPTIGDGEFGNIAFDGVNDYGIINTPSFSYLGSYNFSISIWVNLTSLPLSNPRIVYQGLDFDNYFNIGTYGGNSPGTYDCFWFEVKKGGIFYGGFFDATKKYVINKWYNLTATFDYDTNTPKFYIDGVSVTGSGVVGGAGTMGPLIIANNNTSSIASLPGKIANLRVYNRALSPEEILQNYNAMFYQWTNTLRNRVQSDGGYYEDNSNYTTEIIKEI